MPSGSIQVLSDENVRGETATEKKQLLIDVRTSSMYSWFIEVTF